MARPPKISLGRGLTTESLNSFPRNFASRKGQISAAPRDIAAFDAAGAALAAADAAAALGDQSTASFSCSILPFAAPPRSAPTWAAFFSLRPEGSFFAVSRRTWPLRPAASAKVISVIGWPWRTTKALRSAGSTGA